MECLNDSHSIRKLNGELKLCIGDFYPAFVSQLSASFVPREMDIMEMLVLIMLLMGVKIMINMPEEIVEELLYFRRNLFY